MAQHRCPNCRKLLNFEGAEPGASVMCLACGSRFVIPFNEPTPVAQVFSSPGPSSQPPDATTPETKKQNLSPKDLQLMMRGFGVGLIVAAAVLVTIWLAFLRKPWLRPSRPAPSVASNIATGSVQESAPPPSVPLSPATLPATITSDQSVQTQPSSSSNVTENVSAPTTQPLVASTQPATGPVAATNPVVVVPRKPGIQIHPLPMAATLTDEDIGQSIQHGIDYLLDQLPAPNYILASLQSGFDANYHNWSAGEDALCGYAVIEAGRSVGDARLGPHSPLTAKLIDGMKGLPARTGASVYTRAIRAAALSVYARKEDWPALLADAHYLLEAQHGGAYTYDLLPEYRGGPRNFPMLWDNSNSQYGLMGVWSAADAGVEVPITYWQEVDKHWTTTQLPDGQWSYQSANARSPRAQEPRPTMTAAGIASLFVAHDYSDPVHAEGEVGREPFPIGLRRALHVWESGDYSISIPEAHDARGPFWGYGLYGVARVGLASGFKFFGTHDWYAELARPVIANQQSDGSWWDEINTSYALLFLARARAPIMMNKLRFDNPDDPQDPNHYWDNRPRDLAHLSRWASRELERPLNWQIVSLQRDWSDWTDAPILYIASHQALKFSDEDCRKLREYVDAGGMIFTQADGKSAEFNTFAKELAQRLFPQYPLAPLPADHPLYSVDYRLDQSTPLLGVSNGSRLLMVHCPIDIALFWQHRDKTLHKAAFQLGTNLFVYATGKVDLRNKLNTTYIPEPVGTPFMSLDVARMQYSGNWDPEPGAWPRYGRLLEKRTGIALNIKPIAVKDLSFDKMHFAHLTGTAAIELDPQDKQAIRKFVEDGGVLLIDAAGGSKEFASSMQRMMTSAFPSAQLQPITHAPVLLSDQFDGMYDLNKPRLRSYAVEKGFSGDAATMQILSSGKGHVIFSPLDVSSGLLGTDTYGILGYSHDYSEKFVQNLLLWMLNGQRS